MKQAMPYEIIRDCDDMTNINLDNFFGFCLAEITCPENVSIPILPHKYKNETIFPTGNWSGVYFSEELKAIQGLGYEIKLIKGIEFSKAYIFNDYVDHFYMKKKEARHA